MRLTIVRQDYRPEGLVERVIERALEALDVRQRLGENLRLHGGIDGVDGHEGV